MQGTKLLMADRDGIGSAGSHCGKGVDGAKEKHEDGTLDHKSPHHHKETHGTSDDIDEETPTDEVKGPNILQRVKEEIEALVETVVHPKK